jgi:hypothetical protein
MVQATLVTRLLAPLARAAIGQHYGASKPPRRAERQVVLAPLARGGDAALATSMVQKDKRGSGMAKEGARLRFPRMRGEIFGR